MLECNPTMDEHLIQEEGAGVQKYFESLRATHRLWPDEPLGSYADFTNLFHLLRPPETMVLMFFSEDFPAFSVLFSCFFVCCFFCQ